MTVLAARRYRCGELAPDYFMRTQFLIVNSILVLLAAPTSRAEGNPAGPVSYGQVRAVFARHCLACHDAKEAEGELVLETHAALLKGGERGPAVVPGRNGESLLVRLIEHQEKPFMPPPKKGPKLSGAEIALVRAWIDAGAPGPAPGETVPTATVALPKIAPKARPREAVYAVAYAPGPKLLAVARDGRVELVSAEHRGVVRRLDGHRGKVNDLAFSADGSRLAGAAGEPGARGEARLWNVADGALVRTFEGHGDAVYAVALSSDGRTLATGSYDQKVILWEAETGKQVWELDGHNAAVYDLAFRPDGRVLASAAADRTVKLWDVAAGKRLDTLSESAKELHAVAFTPDGGRLAAGGVDNRIRVWQIGPQATEGGNALLHTTFAHEGAILRLAFSADGKTLLSSADDRTVKLWDAAKMEQRRALGPQPDWPTGLAFVGEGKQIAVGRLDGSVAFYTATDGKEVPPPKPDLVALKPSGFRRGTTMRAELVGKNLLGVTSVKFNNAALSAKVLSDDARAERVWVEITSADDLPTGSYDLVASAPGGDGKALKLHVDDLPQVAEVEPNDSPDEATPAALPASFWGEFGRRGDADDFTFDARAGQTLVFDVAARRLGSKADVALTLIDPAGHVVATANDFDADPDPLLAFTVPTDGRYTVRATDLTAGASDAHFYRLSVGAFAYVTGLHPLGVPASAETAVRLLGHNLPERASATVKAGEGTREVAVPLDPERFRTRRAWTVVAGPETQSAEAEPNDRPGEASHLQTPGAASGRIGVAGDVDLYRFDAKAGATWVIETTAFRLGSPVDTKVEVLHADGRPVRRVILRAVRDSFINFRGIDANGDGARFEYWEEMDLNQYVFMSGEVVKLFRAPRGPDSDYNFYRSPAGKRQTYFDTTATAHALEEKAYVVEPLLPGAPAPPPNGLPAFTLNYANDDDAARQLGSDSRLLFTAPANAAYLVRVTDARGFGGERFTYRLAVRPAEPDFKVSIAEGMNPAVPPGAGRRFVVRVDRIDGFDGPVRVDISNVPEGFAVSTPLVIEAGHLDATGTIYAKPDAKNPSAEASAAVAVTATATVGGKEVVRPVKNFGAFSVGGKPGLTVSLVPVGPRIDVRSSDQAEITVVPGQFVPAVLRVTRTGHEELVTFEVENLPHGVIVADIGLNGVLIPKGESERQIFLQCAPWVAETTRPCHARSNEAGNPTSPPILIHVRRPRQQAEVAP